MSVLKILDQICSVVECGAPKYCKGFCKIHYSRMSRNGTLEKLPHYDCRGPKNPRWKGGKTISAGRVMVRRVGHPAQNAWGYVYRYRIRMEQKLGRYLKSYEIVHHKDGNITNDKISNLELVTSSQHATIHNKTRPRNNKGQFV